MRVRSWCALLGMFTMLAGPIGHGETRPPGNAPSSIAWHDWSVTPFEKAKTENRLVLIDVGIEGCTACRWMDEDTYRDPTVIELIERHFVPIQVDAEARPDIGERYSDWAWPATIFLNPEGTQVLALRGNRRPRNFIPILNKLIEQHNAGKLRADELAPYAAPPAPETTELTVLRDRVRRQLDRTFDRERGGWGKRHKAIEHATPVLHLMMRAHSEDDSAAKEGAMKTLLGMTRMIDPLWGGVFIGSIDGWGTFIPEKRTGSQASALLAFAEGYQLTADARLLDAMRNVDRYLSEWMQSPHGTFYTSQEDEATDLPRDMDARDYYLLDSDAARRKYGLPATDHAVYTDLNARVILAYVRAYEASGDKSFLDKAVRAAESMLTARQHADGWMIQAQPTEALAGDNRMRSLETEARPYLRPQGEFGLALLALYRATTDKHWLDAARRVAAGTRATLEDTALGGFFAGAPLKGAAVQPRKPLEDNATTARFFYELWVYTKDESLRDVPERTLRAVALPDIVRREGKIVGNLAVALETLTTGYVEFTVVGTPDDPAARALYDAGRTVYEPRKILHLEAPGRYPDKGYAAMYICNEDVCSLPIADPEAVARVAAGFRTGALQTNETVTLSQP